MPEWFWYLVVFVYGAIVGSFLNVIIYRMPLGYSISSPPSHCPRCNHYLGFWDNIPLLSFLFLGARCRYCRAPISWRYFTIELMTACLWVALFHRVGGTNFAVCIDFVAQALFASVLIALIFIDLDHFFVPDELNLIGFCLGLARDLILLLLAYTLMRGQPEAIAPLVQKYLWWGWLPQAIPGAIVYGGALFLVSIIGFVYYARGENESFAGALRRFFTFEDELATEEGTVNLAPNESSADEELDEEPVRLRFAPSFITLVGALLLIPVIGWWSLLVFMVPFLLFVLLTKTGEIDYVRAMGLFFRYDDIPNEASGAMQKVAGETTETESAIDTEAAIVEPTEAEALQAQMAAEADQFAREAATGKHGGMGLGDVKLALAVGAILGPGMALLSLMFATFAGAITGLGLARIHGKSLRYGLPFVPFMAFGAILTMLYGDAILDWYKQRAGLNVPVPTEVRIPNTPAR